jgi:hypothetical protein
VFIDPLRAARWSGFGAASRARGSAFLGSFYSRLISGRAKPLKTDAFVQKTRDFRRKTRDFRACASRVAESAPGVNLGRHAPRPWLGSAFSFYNNLL